MPFAHFISVFLSIGQLFILNTSASLTKLAEGSDFAANAHLPTPAMEDSSKLTTARGMTPALQRDREGITPPREFRAGELMKTTAVTERPGDDVPGRAPSYWHPYATPSDNRFIQQAQKAQEQKASAPGRNRGQKPGIFLLTFITTLPITIQTSCKPNWDI
jgi:hypothetical protein